MPQASLLIWPLTAVVESASAGAAAVFILRAATPWRRLLWIFFLALVLFILGVILQNVFFAAAVQTDAVFKTASVW